MEWQGTVNIYERGDIFLTGPKAAIGYKTNSYLSVGAFGGYLLFGDSNGNMGTGLCGIDIRTNFKRGRVIPFANIQMGASIFRLGDMEGYQIVPGSIPMNTVSGFYISPKLGCKFMANGYGIDIYMGYEYSTNLNNGVNFGLGVNFGK